MTKIEEEIYEECIADLSVMKRLSILAVLRKLCKLYGIEVKPVPRRPAKEMK